MKNKIIFIGTSEFAIPALEALAQDENYSISLVITQPDKSNKRRNKIKYSPIKQKAFDLDLDLYQPDNISSIDSEKKLKSLNPDLFVVCSYGQILKENILNIPKYGCINIHGSVLPKYRGASPLHSAIINGEKTSGNTIMLMDDGMDTGPILSQSQVDILPSTTVEELHDILALDGAKLLIETLPNFLENNIIPREQDNNLATYTNKISKVQIDWTKSAEEIRNLVNGLDSFPTAFTVLNNKRIKLFKPVIIYKESQNQPGRIDTVNNDGIVVECGTDYLKFDEIQVPGKKRMKVSEYLRGNLIDSNVILE